MSGRALRTFVVVWLALCVAAFLVLWHFPATDDIAGMVPAMVVLQIPAWFGVHAPDGKPLAAWRCVAIAVPAAIVGAFASFFVFGSIAVAIFNEPLDMTGLLIAFAAAALGCLGCGAALGLYLPRRPHPIAANRVMTGFVIAGVVGGAIVMIFAKRREVALGAMMALVLGWALPLMLITLRKRGVEAPVARVVR